MPKTRARKKTANPNERFWTFKAASNPYAGPFHTDMVVGPPNKTFVRFIFSTVNAEPVKNVPTAVPIKIVPTAPFIIKKAS
jgi:hypothetical protein